MISYSDLTFIIVTFKSEHIIADCLKDIPEECSKIIVENSGNHKFYNDLKSKIPNLKVFVMSDNSGFGKANNFGILNSNTEFLFLINPDTKIYKSEIDKIIKIIQNIDFAIAAPQIIEEFKVYKKNKSNKDYIFVNEVRGMAMLLNKKKFSDSFFDEKFFLYLEEIDLCKRVRMMGQKIMYLDSVLLFFHHDCFLLDVHVSHQQILSRRCREIDRRARLGIVSTLLSVTLDLCGNALLVGCVDVLRGPARRRIRFAEDGV